MKRIMSLFAVSVICVSFSNGQDSYSPENIEGKQLFLRKTINNNRKVYVRADDQEVYYIHQRTRLFPVREPEPVIMREVNQKGKYTELVFYSEHLGKGKIRAYESRSNKLFDAVIRSAFAESIDDAFPILVLNKQSGFVHSMGSNHLPAEEFLEPVSEEELHSGDLVKCPICFSNVPDVSGYDLEMRQGEACSGQVHLRYPLVTDDQIQNRVRLTGERVLSDWVTPLKGYQYKFYAVDSTLANAFACPAGKIYITTGLLDSLESEEELEGILAHEIAHVEMRHGYRQFRSAQKRVFWAGLVAAVAGAATRRTEVFNVVNLIGQFAISIVMSGHSRRYETEADSFANLYFELNDLGQGRSSFRNVLRKLQYHQDFYDPESDGSSLLSTHPDIAARIDAVENSVMKMFSPDDVFYGYDKSGDLVATITFQAQRNYKGRMNPDDVGLQIIATVETTSALGDKVKIKDIKITTGGREIKLDNKEDTEVYPNDAVGVSLVSKSYRSLVDGIDDIKLKLKNVARWEKD